MVVFWDMYGVMSSSRIAGLIACQGSDLCEGHYPILRDLHSKPFTGVQSNGLPIKAQECLGRSRQVSAALSIFIP